MVIKGIIFDVNGTLTNIRTDEGDEGVYRTISNLLSYQGICLGRHNFRSLYFGILDQQRKARGERYPEFDAVAIFQEIIHRHGTDYTRGLPSEKLAQLPLLLAEAYRAASRHQLKLYDGVLDTLRILHANYRLAIVSDAQSAYATAELNALGLIPYFSPILISGDFGYRKPDARLFERALIKMNMQASEVVYVGNDIYRDVHGAQRVGMRTVLFKSNQGSHDKEGIAADYIIYHFTELLNAIKFLEAR